MINSFQYSPELASKAESLWRRIETDPIGVIDGPDIHHQFASLVNHGRKVDMDKIKDGTDFYWQWVDTYAQWVNECYKDRKPDALLGIANGANRLATTMASSTGARGLETRKVNAKTVSLTDEARYSLQNRAARFVLLIEDVGTTGGTTSTVIPELRELGVSRIEVAHTEIRNPQLAVLEQMRIPYGTVIHKILPTFTADDCANLTDGYCNQGIQLIPHGS